MIRLFAGLCMLAVASFLMLADGAQVNAQKVKNNQMVNGTIKSVDVEKSVLVINQKVKNEKVDRELSITEDVEFVIGGKSFTGAKGMEQLKVGAMVKIKCDKDVNVLSVTVK